MKTVNEKQIVNYQTDSFGIVHHARYFEMLEEARWHYCYKNKLMEAFQKKSISHVIVHIDVEYRDSARPGDLILIATEVHRVTENSVVFRQVVTREEQIIVVADITNVFMRKTDQSVISIAELGEFWEDLHSRSSLLPDA